MGSYSTSAADITWFTGSTQFNDQKCLQAAGSRPQRHKRAAVVVRCVVIDTTAKAERDRDTKRE